MGPKTPWSSVNYGGWNVSEGWPSLMDRIKCGQIPCSVNGKFVYEPVFMSVQSGRGLMHWQVDRNARDAQKRLNVHGLNAT